MLRTAFLFLVLSVTGCTSLSLERNTLSQIHTLDSYRAQSAMNCLAVTAATADSLPSFGVLVNGATHIQDSGTATSTTIFTRAINSFASESLGLTFSRQNQPQWSLDPVGDAAKLDALRCACRWAVFGESAACKDCHGLLEDPEDDYSPLEPRFGVAECLRRLPEGWLRCGRFGDVPACAACKARCHDTWVWVMPQDVECLNEFILVLHDIATIDPSATYSQPLLVTITTEVRSKLITDPTKVPPRSPLTPTPPPAATKMSFDEYRVVRPGKVTEVQDLMKAAAKNGGAVDLTWQQWMDYTYAYSGTRSNAKAAGGTPPAGGSGAALQQNLVPPSRNPATSPTMRASIVTQQELNDIGILLRSLPKSPPQP